MRITFFSNFLTHHQIPFCDEIFKELGDNFTFVSTKDIPDSFIKSGYPDSREYTYNLLSYKNSLNYEKAIALGKDSDIVIIGSAPHIFIKERLQLNRHTFKYSERILKKGLWRLLDPFLLYSLFKSHTLLRDKNVYMLCASAYTANDLNLFLSYPQKKFKWGYFTRVEKLEIEQLIDQRKDDCIQLLWVSRFIDWKHPELAVKLAFELKKRGLNFNLNMIGDGQMYEKIEKMIEKLELSEYVTLLKNMSNSEVRNHMKRSSIFLFTSDRNEGWGAVLNEAMSVGCAVIASNMIGAAPFLIKHEHNGLFFKSKNLMSLVGQTERLYHDRLLRKRISINAYKTMYNEWSPEIASERFLNLAKSILENNIITYEKGPCSIAKTTSLKCYEMN